MTLRLKGSYSVSAAENPTYRLPFKPITCNVIFLDDKSELFKLDKNARGQVLIDLVFDFLELLERDFFGLQYNDFNCNPGPLLRWLEPTKTLKKQLRGTITHTLWLRVKFYVPDPLWLQEEFTRYLVYLQVRKDVLNGILVAPTPILAKMAGLCLQSELGDYSTEDCKPGYVNHIRLVPNQTSEFEAEAAEAHKSFRSYVPATSELKYLYMARGLELYGIHPQEVTDRSRTKLRIGVSAQGLSVFRDVRRIFLYAWENVEKIAFSGKTFSVNLKYQPRPASLSKSDSVFETSKSVASGKQNLTPTYFFESAKHAKVFWQSAVTCHTFFRVREPTSSGQAFPTLNGGFQAVPISATTHLSSSASSPGGFSRFFRLRGTRTRRSLSTGTASVGLERTMSTLMELRRRSKSIEHGFFRLLRGVSRRFSRRRSIAAPGRTQSVSLLNAYESRDSLGMHSIPSLLDEVSPLPKDPSTDLEMNSTSEHDVKGPPRLQSSETKPVVVGRNDRAFPRRFRSSVPPLSRLKDHELLPSHVWDLEGEMKPNAADNQNAPLQTSPILKREKGRAGDSSSLNDSPLERSGQRRRDTGRKVSTTTREDVVLPRPTAFFSTRPGDHLPDEARQNSRTGMGLATKINVEKSPSVRRSWESNASTSEMRYHQSVKTPNRPTTAVGVATDTSSVSPNTSDENFVTVRIWPSAEGQYGFNVYGGVDQKKPVIVSRVGDNLPASTASPRLHRGDQIIRINDRDISDYTQDQVISSIQKAAKSRTGYLELVVKPDANYLGEDVMDDQVTDTGDAPPRPPKSTAFTESRNSLRNASPAGMWVSSSSPSQRLDVSPSNHHYHRCQSQQPQHQQQLQMGPPSPLSKPRINSYGTVRDKSFFGMGLRKALTSGTESLYLSIMDVERGLADGSLIRQFEKLERGDPHATTLDARINVGKNRYQDISPYDHTRVKIVGADGDYINASFIEMTIPKAALRKYIASQGPLKTTCADFWQMCWEHDSELIVMLTDVGEQGREKCYKYWPNKNETIEFTWTQPKSSQVATSSSDKCVQLRISNVKEEEKGNTAYREFQVQRIVITVKDATAAGLSLKPSKPSITSFSREKGPSIVNGAEVRRIVQLQYLRWPDHGVPSNCDDLIAFVERMRELRACGKSTCAVVHCSAGIGRTGVVILLDTAMDMIHAQSPVKPIEMVREMRMFRKRLVQTSAQFKFVCEAIVKYHADTILKRTPIKKS